MTSNERKIRAIILEEFDAAWHAAVEAVAKGEDTGHGKWIERAANRIDRMIKETP